MPPPADLSLVPNRKTSALDLPCDADPAEDETPEPAWTPSVRTDTFLTDATRITAEVDIAGNGARYTVVDIDNRTRLFLSEAALANFLNAIAATRADAPVRVLPTRVV